MTKKIKKGRSVKGTITKQRKDKDPEIKEEEVAVSEIEEQQPLCNVGFTAGFTYPEPNYANTKVSVSLYVPCSYNELEDVYDFTKDWVEEKLEEAYAELEG